MANDGPILEGGEVLFKGRYPCRYDSTCSLGER